MNKDQLLHWKIPEFIGTKGDFKNMKTMLHDERRIMTQQVHQLKSEVANSKSEAWDSQYELAEVKDRLEDIENKRQEAEKENAALAACHKAGK
jgi:ubiquinone biosynthesis protein UbiJ